MGGMMKNEQELLVVDDEPSVRDIVCRGLSLQGYSCVSASNSDEAIAVLEQHVPAVVISDIYMPGSSGVWLLQQVKKRWPDTSVIMLTAIDETQSAVSCLTQGADDYIVKPINLKELALSVERALEKRRLILENKAYQRNLEILVEERTDDLRKTLQQLKHSYDMTLEALVAALDAREYETGRHSHRVSMYAITLAKKVGLPHKDLSGISKGALLHDIGKIGIPDSVLLKQGSLTEDEWKLMKRHPEIGYHILKNIDFLEPAIEIVLNHHERYDGKGYPGGMEAEEIPVGARIFLVVDAFDAITTDRPYRKAAHFSKAFKEIEKSAGSQLDPRIVEVFLSIPVNEWEKIRLFTLK
jgi:putative nucleotidyltransferase with HDIG domain